MPRLTTIPFPTTRFIPGHPHSGPRPTHTPPLSPDWSANPKHWRESHDYLWGIDLFNHGFTWESHEAFEVVWKQLKAKSEEAAATRATQVLIQTAAARLKHEIGNTKGVHSLLLRASANASYIAISAPNTTLMGLNINAWFDDVIAWFKIGDGVFPMLDPK